MREQLQRSIPLLAAFGSGAAVMSLELFGSRIVAPYLGSSVLIWTNLIGVILFAMAIGAWAGGVLADRFPSIRWVAMVLGIVGFWCFGLAYFSGMILRVLSLLPYSTSALLASLVLLAPPAFLLAGISPAVLRLMARDVDSLGETAGLLSACGTIGSLFGTYVTGYVLLPRFPLHQLLLGLGFILLISAALLYQPWKKRWTAISHAALFLPGLVLWPLRPAATIYPSAYADVFTWRGEYSGKDSMILQINTGRHAVGLFEDRANSVLGYVHGMETVEAFLPTVSRALVLGGGGFHVVSSLQKRFPEASIDVVEIDPAIVEAAKADMGFVQATKTEIFLADARTAVRERNPGYDLIVSDVFSADISVPWHVLTKESLQDVSKLLAPDGMYTANLIFAAQPTDSVAIQYGKNLMATFHSAFAWTVFIDMANSPSSNIPSNVLVFAGNGKQPSVEALLQEADKRIADGARPIQIIPPMDGGMIWTDDFGNADYQSVEMYRQAWGK